MQRQYQRLGSGSMSWSLASIAGLCLRSWRITDAFPDIESKALCNGLAFFLAAITSVAWPAQIRYRYPVFPFILTSYRKNCDYEYRSARDFTDIAADLFYAIPTNNAGAGMVGYLADGDEDHHQINIAWQL